MNPEGLVDIQDLCYGHPIAKIVFEFSQNWGSRLVTQADIHQ